MKKTLSGIIPLILIHIICCGGALIFLISSGYLLKLSNESQNRFFLIPSILLLFLAWKQTGKQNGGLLRGFIYGSIYFLTSYIIITYLFIPWWIPGYTGGLLLP